MAFLEIKGLHASIEGKEILTGLSLNIDKGEVHAIMGPNGSGKSTLANVLLGHPKYNVTSGEVLVQGQGILDLATDERAKKGLFLGFQYPTEISGVGYSHFLRNAYNTLSKSLREEKKRSEVMQMLVLKPNIAILDEPDSGLDIDSVKSVAEAINKLIALGAGVVVITHYARILRYLTKLDKVHVMAKGKIIKSGGRELSEELETKGYVWLGLEDK
jgi:Fe-S cluster assembly ATP-binding protein